MNEIDKQAMEQMLEQVKSTANRFSAVPRNIINDRAEIEAEAYTANLGLEGEIKEGAKQQYIQMFREEIIKLI